MMNERIDELLWQAGGYTKIHNPNDSFLDGRYAITQEQLDKFAELIVRECIDVVEGDDGDSHVRQLLLQHFGDEK